MDYTDRNDRPEERTAMRHCLAAAVALLFLAGPACADGNVHAGSNWVVDMRKQIA